MIIPVSPNVHKVYKEGYIKEPDINENIIRSCEHIDKCGAPLYVGRCREECFKRFRGDM